MTISTNEEKVLGHLGYEWWMFKSLTNLVSNYATQDDPVRNAIVESIAMHARNLIEFFYLNKKNYHSDDWNSTDVRMQNQNCIPSNLKDWVQQAHKRIAHMSNLRDRPIQDWNLTDVESAISTEISTLRQTFGLDFPQKWLGDQPSKQAGSQLTFQPTGPSKPY